MTGHGRMLGVVLATTFAASACGSSKVLPGGDGGAGGMGRVGSVTGVGGVGGTGDVTGVGGASGAGGGAGGGFGGVGPDGGVGGAGGPRFSFERNISGLAYGDGTFVAGGSEGPTTDIADLPGVIYASSDGLAWTRVLGGLVAPVVDVARGGGRFVALASGYSPGPSSIPSARALVSQDGQTWSGVDLAGPPAGSRLAFGNGLFVVVASNGYLRSTDGLAWTAFGPVPVNAPVVTFAGGHFVSWSWGAFSVLASTGGDWQSVDLPGGSPYFRAFDLRAVNDGFVGITQNDCCYGEEPDSIRWGTVRSADGVTWTSTATDLTAQPPVIVLDEGSLCVAFQGGRRVLSGAAGCDSLAVSFADDDFLPVQAIHAGGVYLVAGWTGILSSTDGLHWTKSLWSE